MKSKIIIVLGCVVFIGLYAGAEQSQASVPQKASVPQQESVTDTTVLKVPEVTVNKPKRNGFVSSTFGVIYFPDLDFDPDSFTFAISTSYGEVVGKSDIADAGTFEATTSISGAFSAGDSAVAVNGATEINFIKNDGMNKLVPGFSLKVSLGYVDDSSSIGYFSAIGGEIYLKAFVSKQFALVPYMSITYAYLSGGVDDSGRSVSVRGSGLALSGGIGLRRYF